VRGSYRGAETRGMEVGVQVMATWQQQQ
jgi:hypothetical protein